MRRNSPKASMCHPELSGPGVLVPGSFSTEWKSDLQGTLITEVITSLKYMQHLVQEPRHLCAPGP